MYQWLLNITFIMTFPQFFQTVPHFPNNSPIHFYLRLFQIFQGHPANTTHHHHHQHKSPRHILPFNHAGFVLLQILQGPLQFSDSNRWLFQLGGQTSDLCLQLTFTFLGCITKLSDGRVFLFHCTIQLRIPSANTHRTDIPAAVKKRSPLQLLPVVPPLLYNFQTKL